jgi:hypothetical protein
MAGLERMYPENNRIPTYPQNDCPACNRGEVLRNHHPYDGFTLPQSETEPHYVIQLWPHLPSLSMCLKFVPPELVESYRRVKAGEGEAPQLRPGLSVLCQCGHPSRFHWELEPFSLASGSCRIAEIPRGDDAQMICSCKQFVPTDQYAPPFTHLNKSKDG